jgi:protocatechuate 3,4-dioxygenase beta subunit
MKPTSADIEGPFYKKDAPFKSDLVDKPTLRVIGSVYNTNGELLNNAILDIWHADEKGAYDMEGFNFRGKVNVNADANYEFHTIVPGDYPLDDGEFRCSHLHIKVFAPGYKLLTTQLYFPDDPHNETDQWFDESRVIGYPEGVFDFVLEKL